MAYPVPTRGVWRAPGPEGAMSSSTALLLRGGTAGPAQAACECQEGGGSGSRTAIGEAQAGVAPC